MKPAAPNLPRLNNIVVLRSFAIIAVVLYHCYCPWMSEWNWFECKCRPIYSFILEVMFVGRMPLFVFVSGYLFSHLVIDRGKYTSFLGFVNNKFQRLLIPCLVFTGLMCLCLQENYFEAVVGYGYHLWFLKMLFWCFMTAWLLNRFVKSKLGRIAAFVLSLGLMGFHGITILGLGQYYKYFSFFYGGYLFYAYRESLSFIFKRWFIYFISLTYAGLLLVVLARYICAEETDGMIHGDRIVAFARYLLRPVTIILALILVDLYLKTKDEISIIFTKLNSISYGIYLFHMLILQSLHKYCFSEVAEFANSHYIFTPPMLFVLVTGLSVAICTVLKRYSWSKWLIG